MIRPRGSRGAACSELAPGHLSIIPYTCGGSRCLEDSEGTPPSSKRTARGSSLLLYKFSVLPWSSVLIHYLTLLKSLQNPGCWLCTMGGHGVVYPDMGAQHLKRDVALTLVTLD